MSCKNFLSIYFLSSILLSQEEIPFDVSKHFAVILDNNQLIWNLDQSFEKLLITFKNFFEVGLVKEAKVSATLPSFPIIIL